MDQNGVISRAVRFNNFEQSREQCYKAQGTNPAVLQSAPAPSHRFCSFV